MLEARAARARPARSSSYAKPTRALPAPATPASRARRGERIIFIDDDVLPLPKFVDGAPAVARERRPRAIVRGGAINVDDLDDLPPPIWSIKDYSGNYFWTTNVSAPLADDPRAGGFNGRLRSTAGRTSTSAFACAHRGVRAVFNPKALVYH